VVLVLTIGINRSHHLLYLLKEGSEQEQVRNVVADSVAQVHCGEDKFEFPAVFLWLAKHESMLQ
jgi:hypothetical protein